MNSLTKLVLVNAVYFKGNWMQKFDSSLTAVQPFYLGSKDKQKNVNMMHIDAEFRTGYIESLDARLLELPYRVVSSFKEYLVQILFLPKFSSYFRVGFLACSSYFPTKLMGCLNWN